MPAVHRRKRQLLQARLAHRRLLAQLRVKQESNDKEAGPPPPSLASLLEGVLLRLGPVRESPSAGRKKARNLLRLAHNNANLI